MKKLLFAGVVSGFIVLALTGCYNDKYDQLYPAPPVVTCDTSAVTYSNDIVPILNANCNIAGGCHDATGSATSGFNFTTYSGLTRSCANGNLIGDINWANGHNNMPKTGAKLSQCDINKITVWVSHGYPNN